MLGKVDSIYVLARKDNKENFMKLAKEKLEERVNPSDKSWDEKMKIKQSCLIVEGRNGDFFCDCMEGIKGKICKHTASMHYWNETGMSALIYLESRGSGRRGLAVRDRGEGGS